MRSLFAHPPLALVSLLAVSLSACAGRPAAAVRGDSRDDPEVIDGDPDFSGKEYLFNRTVHVLTPRGACSGTALLPNAVLTARHCVTSDSSVEGAFIPASDVRTRIGKPARGPEPADLCTGPDRDATCARGQRIFDLGQYVDIVVVELEATIGASALPVPFTPIELDSPMNAYLNTTRTISGWGGSRCEDVWGGTLRWGQVKVSAVSKYFLTLSPGATGQEIWKGDSGGPTWGDMFPFPVISVHSRASCSETNADNLGFDVPLREHLSGLHDALASVTPDLVTRELGTLTAVDRVPADGGNWQIQDGHLRQLATTEQNVALMRELAFQQLVDTELSVNISGSGSGASGIVLNYYDPQNYVRCELTGETKQLRLIGRLAGTDYVLQSVPWNTSSAADITMVARMQRGSAGAGTFSCSVSGGSEVASGSFPRLTAGRVGVFNRTQANTSYWHFAAKKL